jgi:beta-glucanase (GH16 family)
VKTKNAPIVAWNRALVGGWIVFLSIAASMLAACDHQPEGEPLEWRLLWQDEFEGPAGQSPDAAKWIFDTGGDGWGNAQLEHNTDRPENVSLDGNGNLAIIARKEYYEGNNYTSGRINTRGLFARKEGRFEARIQLPVGQGIWPAFWLLGANFDAIGWPECGEIDIMEYRGQEPTIVSGALHGPGYSGGRSLGGRFILNGEGFHTAFHVFAIEWDEEGITWFVDGEPYMTITPDNLPGGTRWVYDHPFFILLNVAVGGNFVGSPNAQTSFPQTMRVDWVRVYGYSNGS